MKYKNLNAYVRFDNTKCIPPELPDWIKIAWDYTREINRLTAGSLDSSD
jgi:hypothetical protein